MKKILLDTREMEHPLPLQLALNHLQKITINEYLYMIHRKKPLPLLEVAKEKAFSCITHKDINDTWHILISKNNEKNLEELLDV